MRRVAYVCADPGIPVFGSKGASVHVQAVLRVLLRRGVEVHLLAVRTGGPVPDDLRGLHVHALPAVTGADAAQREASARAADAAVADVLRVLPALDLVYERYSLWGRSGTAWAAAAGVPSVLEVNAPLVQEQAEHRGLADRGAAEQTARAALGTAGTVACVSEAVAAWARAAGAPGERVVVVPNGVDVERVTPARRPRTPAAAARFTVGFVGTLKPWHGVEVLVEAVARLRTADPSWRLLLVGDGPRADALRAQGDEAGLGEGLELTGAVPPAQVPALLHRVDVAVAPYPDLPGFYFSPLKLYEYLAAGLPVVASAVGQVPGALDGGRLGVLVAPGDAGALADALHALRADEARRERLGAAAREAAVRHHTWEAAVDRALARAVPEPAR